MPTEEKNETPKEIRKDMQQLEEVLALVKTLQCTVEELRKENKDLRNHRSKEMEASSYQNTEAIKPKDDKLEPLVPYSAHPFMEGV
ncbi:hypothetical protein RJT34_22696 [Clitoria ternatea]|uniref:Uncharacterized protein n=1 Tax=Clitoria ternatea TaxID=43366 RepID=A0AAN9FMR9_CLITE